MDMIRGQRAKLADLCATGRDCVVELQAQGPLALDFSCFGLDTAGRLGDERYMTFFNQPSTPCNGVQLADATPGRASFRLALARLPAAIERLVFTAAIDGPGTMARLQQGALRIRDGGQTVATFAFTGADFQAERALMVGELYRKDDGWRLAAVGQGFNGGLDALVRHFGGQVASSAAAAPASPPAPGVAVPPAPAPAEASTGPAPKVSLSKVTLQKTGDKVSLEKRGAQGFGQIRVNLNWNRQPKRDGLLGSMLGPKKIDLDIGCMYELQDGGKGVVQALGKRWGSLEQPPYIRLDADDRTGAASGGENLFINGDRFDRMKRILVFAFIYEGVPNWAATDGVVLVEAPGQPPVEVRLDRSDSKGMCAVAMIENQHGQLVVTKLVEYFHGHPDMDKGFGFGFNWKAGHK